MLDMIKAEEARAIAAEADPTRETAAADTLSNNAISWAIRNAIHRTDTRIRMYAKFGREQDLISPIQTARILNTYSSRLAKFVNDLQRLGYEVEVGNGDEKGNGKIDNNTIVVKWA